METIIFYLIKSSALIAVFFMAYYFLLRKETFFQSNRWFLLFGLIASLVLPLITFQKIIWVETQSKLTHWTSIPSQIPTQSSSFHINWFLVLACVYSIGFLILLFQFALEFKNLYLILKGKTINNQNDFKLIDVTENRSPFSFFNYIVFNSSLYYPNELENILHHEKIHCQQKHTIDVILSRFFCIFFWYNPFIWLTHKAILQNLEFIADSEALKKITDKKGYQFTLLKVTTHDHCVAITNHFYQSLIKKRIVMLNKNQSKKSKSWKYAMIMPFLFAFMFYYQVKVVAQEKKEAPKEKNAVFAEESAIYIYKNSTDAEMKTSAAVLQKNNSVFIKFSKIKRNSKGEITAIRIDYKDKVGKKGTSIIDGDEPIDNLTIFRTKNSIEISSNDKKNEVYETAIANEEVTDLVEFTDPVSEKTGNIEINNIDFPTPPTPPTPPTFNFNAPKAPNFPTAPRAPKGSPEKGDKKEWATFEQKMKAFDKKMEAMAPQMKEFDKKMTEFDEQMKPFDAKMKIFEKNMKIYEKQMEEYREKMNEN